MKSSSGFTSISGLARFVLKPLLAAILIFLPAVVLNSQPVWVPTTPSLGPAGPTSIPINYGIDRAGTIYIIVLNYNNPNQQAPTSVRSQAINPTLASVVFNAVIPIAGANINAILQVIAGSLAANTYHTIYLTAEDSNGVLQTTSIRLNATTLVCPKLNYFTFFGNLGECVNLGAQGAYQVAPIGALPTGVRGGYHSGRWTWG